MTDLQCTECGITTSYADASIEDYHRSCGGNKHDWVEIQSEYEIHGTGAALDHIVLLADCVDGVTAERDGDELVTLSGDIFDIDKLRELMTDYRLSLKSRYDIATAKIAEQKVFNAVY